MELHTFICGGSSQFIGLCSLLCVFSHNKFLICGEMASSRDSGSQTGSRNAPSSKFSCGFNIAGRLGQLHETGQAVGLHGCRAY